MIIRYKFKLRDPMIFEDFWPIPILGGKLLATQNDGKITGFIAEFKGRDPSFSPDFIQNEEDEVKAHIIGRDKLLPFVKAQIEEAFAFLQCYFNVEVISDEIHTEYIAESENERQRIKVMSFNTTKNDVSPLVPFDIFVRAVMAAEKNSSPILESRFLQMARGELFRERYIDSFRYSFLLIESVYGGGKFKSVQLKQELKQNANFVRVVTNAIADRLKPKRIRKQCDTENLLSGGSRVDDIIDHIVEKRGYYFHGNSVRRNPWRPHEQEEAESLSLLTLAIANQIAIDAAKPMFDERLVTQYHEAAKEAGAIMKVKVTFRFKEAGENFEREGGVHMNVPGTTPTPKQAVYLANRFLEHFKGQLPSADLLSAECIEAESGKQLFVFQVKA